MTTRKKKTYSKTQDPNSTPQYNRDFTNPFDDPWQDMMQEEDWRDPLSERIATHPTPVFDNRTRNEIDDEMTSQKEDRENVNLSTPIFDNRPQADLIRDKIKDKNETKASYLEKHPPGPPRRSSRKVERKPFTGGRRSKRRRKSKKSNKRFRKTRRSKRQKGGMSQDQRNDDIIRLSSFNDEDVRKVIANLLREGVSPVAKNTALIMASQEGHTEIVAMLLEKGANVNAKTKDGRRALFLASANGHAEIVAMLLAAGADVNAKDNDGWTALIVASWYGHTETVAILLQNGADVNAKRNYDGFTALILASKKGHTDIVKLLKQYLILPVVQKHSQRQRDRVNLSRVLQGVRGTSNRGPDGKLPTDIIRMMEGDTSATGPWNSINSFLGGKRKTRKSKKSKRKTRKTRRK